jgi:hypothetical protein
MQKAEERSWHVASWPLLAWVETIIKLAALVVALAAFVSALGGGAWRLPSGVALAQWVVLIVLSLGLVAAIFDRLQERELVAMAFVVVNNLGHWGMVVAMLAVPGPGWRLPLFCGLMLLGDLVKLVFLKMHDFQVRDVPRVVLYGLTGFYVVGYVAILLLGWLG